MGVSYTLKTLHDVAGVLGSPPEVDGKTWLLKAPYALVIEETSS